MRLKDGTTEIQEIKNNRKVIEDKMKLQANCSKFIEKSILPLKEGLENSVLVQIDQKFSEVLENVISQKKIKRAYDVIPIKYPKPDLPIKYSIILYIEAK